MIDLTSTTDRLAALLDGVGDEALTAPTPCEDYTVGTLLDHLMGLSLAFTLAARKERTALTDNAPRPDAADLDPAWREMLPRRLRELASAWNAPGSTDGDTTVGGVTLPATAAEVVALDEVAVHGWDLARAIGKPWRLDEEVSSTLIDFLGQDADDQSAREGMFGPVVPVAADADPVDRVVALAGRDPAWTRPTKA